MHDTEHTEGSAAAAGDSSAIAPFRDRVRLACVPGIGGRLHRMLLAAYGSPAGVFAASKADLRTVAGIGPKLADSIREAAASAFADETIALCKRAQVTIILHGDANYPRLLTTIPDPPPILFVRGSFQSADALAVAVVGSRHSTPYGLRIAERLAGDLVRSGYTVVSGLARGIDAAAHAGAIAAGGRTLAVLGSGVLNIYPPEHDRLAEEVIAHGAVFSETPPLASPHAGAFPQRNRIVSGLSLGTVVVQAANRSGALITARLASEQGREVFAVPGPVDCRLSQGCHSLIRDGAKLVATVDDILEELGPLFEKATTSTGREVSNPVELQLDDLERTVLEAVTAGGAAGTDIDAVVEGSNLAASQVLATIGVLEMRRLLRRLPGSRVQRV
ncbi:MAG: DNA-protecting protein DprA [Planctomycetota bacterium]|nr:MAG: DNA-protecting protein DprA [Planctomycetota bacterium]